AKTHTKDKKKSEYNYEYFKDDVTEEAKKLGNVEFNVSFDLLYQLLLYGADEAKMFLEIEKTENILTVLRGFEKKYGYKFVDDESKNNCVSRIKKRLNSFVIEGVLTEEYLKQGEIFFWIEQRVGEEMSVKVYSAKQYPDKRKMCYNKNEIKKVKNDYEKEKCIKYSPEMIHNNIVTVGSFLVDILRESTFIRSKY
ncbi:gamete antigen 27/25 (G27/25), partial [Plasmodium malariae]